MMSRAINSRTARVSFETWIREDAEAHEGLFHGPQFKGSQPHPLHRIVLHLAGQG